MIDLRWIFCILDTLSVFLRIFGGVFMKERNIHKQRHYSVPRITATTCIRSLTAPCPFMSASRYLAYQGRLGNPVSILDPGAMKSGVPLLT